SQGLLRDLAAASPLSFRAFMEAALYHPAYGFYSQAGAVVGRGGHFTTVPQSHPLLAQGLAEYFCRVTANPRNPPSADQGELSARYSQSGWTLMEAGGGAGALMLACLFALKEKASASSALPEIALAERAPARLAEQVAALAKAGLAAGKTGDTPVEILKARQGPLFLFSNELIDAFPAVQLCWWQGQWREVWLEFGPEGFRRERFEPRPDGLDCAAPSRPREGQRMFVHPDYHQWLHANLSELQAGVIVTIDYGRHFPSSECRGYYRNHRSKGFQVYERPGQQDLTCDVNFADVRRWGEQLGWQTDFDDLLCAFLADTVAPSPNEAEDPVAQRLRNPFDAGGAFRVLVQSIGLELG
ncbi:MAG: SAM-dependent methyltransferase, partial [Opitutales bacterium]